MTQVQKRSLALVLIATVVGAALAVAGSQYGWSFAGLPGFTIAVGVAFIVQWIAYIPAAIAVTDRYFDATGSVTYIGVTLLLVLLAPSLDPLRLILAAMVVLWALRLGTFLLLRNIRSGGDDRFDEIKSNRLRFLSVWTIQGLWVSITASAAWIALSSGNVVQVSWITWVGMIVWALGFGLEVVADLQKDRFKKDVANVGKFVQTGLWSVVRHPNYLGEILLWIGVFIVAAPVLLGWQWVAILSPVFVTFLLTKVSGIPLLEAKARRKWGEDPNYQAYLDRTPALLPFSRR